MPRFMRKGRTKIYFSLTAASLAAVDISTDLPTAEELTPELAEINGFTFKNSPIMVPDMDNAYVSQIGGEDTADESSMTFYENDAIGDNPIRDALAKDTAGFVLIFPYGLAGASPAAGDDYEIWPCVVTSNARTYTTGNEAGQYQVSFSITSPPAEGSLVA